MLHQDNCILSRNTNWISNLLHTVHWMQGKKPEISEFLSWFLKLISAELLANHLESLSYCINILLLPHKFLFSINQLTSLEWFKTIEYSIFSIPGKTIISLYGRISSCKTYISRCEPRIYCFHYSEKLASYMTISSLQTILKPCKLTTDSILCQNQSFCFALEQTNVHMPHLCVTLKRSLLLCNYSRLITKLSPDFGSYLQ